VEREYKEVKIVASCRTLNESKHIAQWCKSYSEFADVLIIGDGGSIDDTVEIALQYPKVQVRNYDVKVELPDGSWRNPDGPHIQFLVDWATELGGDWLVHQDTDQRPNKYLKDDIRSILEKTESEFLQVTQIFLWGKDQYFPHLSQDNENWQQGLWAWKLSTGLKIINKMPHYEFSLDGVKSININEPWRKVENLLPPYCFMHYGWQTEEEVQAHIKYYRKTELIKDMAHPLQFGGKTKKFEEWMIE